MRERYKHFVSIAIIVILLPYILAVFIKGEGGTSVFTLTDYTYVEVEVQGEVLEMTWEEYMVGLLAKEIPEEYDLEAMKAQSVIIQTRLLATSGGEESYVYQEEFYTTEMIQTKWENQSVTYYNLLIQAVEETQGITLAYEGEVASVPYHALNTGMTRNGNEVLNSDNYPYLVSVSCPLDVESDQEINVFTISYEELTEQLEEELELNLENDFVYDDIEILEKDEARYVLSIEIQGNAVSGELFRTTLGLKSSAFSLQEMDGNLKITTEGVGHGLGLSQNTAHYMALEGKTYEEILAYFYPGTEIVTP